METTRFFSHECLLKYHKLTLAMAATALAAVSIAIAGPRNIVEFGQSVVEKSSIEHDQRQGSAR